MRIIRYLALLIFISVNSMAQKNYFLYIQTENKQPFSVRMDGKIYSSSDMGYVIVPRLLGGDYVVTIDFPKNLYPSRQFDLSLNHQDLGFVLKNMNSNDLVLENLQTSQRINAKNKEAEQEVASDKEADDFTKTLSQITNTPLPEEKKIIVEEKATDRRILKPVDSVQTSIVMEEQKIDSSKGVVEKIESLVDSVQTSIVMEEQKTDSAKGVVQKIESLADTVQLSVVNDIKKERSDVSLFFSTTDSSGQSLIYVVSQSGAMDTVVIFIPAENNSIIVVPIKDTVKDMVVEDVAAASTTVDTLALNTEKNTPAIKCDKVAVEKDFLQLRKKMASQDKENDMLQQAEKAFQSKCFSTQQIRNLSGLFLEEDKKLDFLILCRTKLTDPENFGSLISLLSGESNIIKFKEVIQ